MLYRSSGKSYESFTTIGLGKVALWNAILNIFLIYPAVPRLRDLRFARRSKTLQGRKRFMSANEGTFQSSPYIIPKFAIIQRVEIHFLSSFRIKEVSETHPIIIIIIRHRNFKRKWIENSGAGKNIKNFYADNSLFSISK